jgi:LPS-assembly lipoprotein
MLAGCGFTPMYATPREGSGLVEKFAAIQVAPIADRVGQVVRNGLMDRLTPHGQPGAPLYRLQVTLGETREGFGFRPDEAITRENLRLDATYRLLRTADGEMVLEGSARSNLAYDIVQSDFANFSARQDARRRTAEQVINIIVVRLGLFLKNE